MTGVSQLTVSFVRIYAFGGWKHEDIATDRLHHATSRKEGFAMSMQAVTGWTPTLKHGLGLGFSLLLAIIAVTSASAQGAGGVGGPAFYVDGVRYRTVGTPTDLSRTGAPADTFDILYDLGGVQPLNVAEAAPGDRDYNGGRWMVHQIGFSNYAGALADPTVDLNNNDVLDSDTEVLAAIAKGYATDAGVIRQFLCPVIKIP
jgi:hypothetical protein